MRVATQKAKYLTIEGFVESSVLKMRAQEFLDPQSGRTCSSPQFVDWEVTVPCPNDREIHLVALKLEHNDHRNPVYNKYPISLSPNMRMGIRVNFNTILGIGLLTFYGLHFVLKGSLIMRSKWCRLVGMQLADFDIAFVETARS